MTGKRVLIIAYYFPPLGMGGVQRASKLAKYLPQLGYSVDVLTVKPIRYPAHDASLLDELPETVKLHRAGSTDPARIAHLLKLRLPRGTKLGSAVKRSGRYWPDSKIGWKKKALAMGERIIAENRPDIILSTSPPMTAHLIAMELAEKHHIKWVADFRDFWESRQPEDVFSDDLVIKKSYGLLHRIHKQADMVTRVNDAIGSEISDKPISLQGGYDPSDFVNIETETDSSQFLITYLGSSGPLCPLDRIIEAVGRARDIDSLFANDVKVKIIGQNEATVLEECLKKNNLTDRVAFTGYLSHQTAIREASHGDLSLISLAEDCPGILPGKIFDLLPLSAPILAVVPEPGEAAKIIRATNAGLCVSPTDVDQVAEKMLYFYQRQKNRESWAKENISQFSRIELARKFSEVFEKVIDN